MPKAEVEAEARGAEAFVTQRALAKALGVSDRRVRQLAADKILPPPRGGLHDLALCKERFRAYRSSTRPNGTPAQRPRRGEGEGGEGGGDLEAERTRKLRLENDETERLLIRIEDAIAAIDAIVGQIPADLAAVAPRVTDDIALRRRIEDEIDHALNGLARRFAKATAALEKGHDPLGQEAEDDADAVGALE
ncbi:hypothetical protein JRF84_31000 [Methylobacterium organophilum]|uniref:hypothetical protein n=1 Tax=Methylobacterium organophilum TaxID=410 RepID=UPI0019D313FB|nr:hypothetical protein [Methylobacterium organophilum]MBN6823994.1 hypothetical protein [Methylobacterium organophilum]